MNEQPTARNAIARPLPVHCHILARGLLADTHPFRQFEQIEVLVGGRAECASTARQVLPNRHLTAAILRFAQYARCLIGRVCGDEVCSIVAFNGVDIRSLIEREKKYDRDGQIKGRNVRRGRGVGFCCNFCLIQQCVASARNVRTTLKTLLNLSFPHIAGAGDG
ncbi:hypothetical protein [Labrys miyagiensis]|uniref:hypothetical protein n=1 Tax=Labrys miyagiensis TaxID=346912 RepID=UPI0024E134E0|nr:hypothetical protein [Labrys miyagiensis]